MRSMGGDGKGVWFSRTATSFESRGIGLIPCRSRCICGRVDRWSNGRSGRRSRCWTGDGLKMLSIRFPFALRELLQGHTFKDNVLVPMVTVLTLFRDFAVRRGHVAEARIQSTSFT